MSQLIGVQDQITHLKEKGITFLNISEKDAKSDIRQVTSDSDGGCCNYRNFVWIFIQKRRAGSPFCRRYCCYIQSHYGM